MPRIGQKRRASEADDIEDNAIQAAAVKKSKSIVNATAAGRDDDGNPYWELSHKRRVAVSQFKKMCFVNIREYYDKDGKMLPGRKGISLSVEQYIALLKAAPAITAALREKGEEFDEPEAIRVPEKASRKTKPVKSNIEATSDEDEGEDEGEDED
ncbi:putative RNA polymerase II transcriptional coactivator [Escovopsis weberi]|uniref:Putative RNA polymerase II transcriptional coactivator n=1 Tax=Escovopsis weberi TaxID=150374 RepID=A0A0M8N5H3_ESCWE|nr:putative RNA polymerase II transcriptional coactivator [Escovopsis weberi]